MIAGIVLFAQLALVAHAPDSVAVCDAVEITVAVSAPGTHTPRLIVPSFTPFDVLRSAVAPRVQLDPRNGGSLIAEYRYVVTTEHAGAVTIAPFEARLGRDVARSRPLRIFVRGPRTGLSLPTVVARARIDTSLDVNFRALTAPETVYVGQQANYEVAVFLNETVRERLRRNPTFYPPDMQGMLAYDLPPLPGATTRGKGATRCFDALVYQRALFPLVAGRFVIPPAQLAYSFPLSPSFFSREESHELQTDSTILVAVEPPVESRPNDFAGAVGDFAVAARLDSARARVGDPLLLTVRISGTGNVKLLPAPLVEVPWASIVQADERVSVDSSARRIRGSKEFDWVLTPRIAGELDVPPIRYSYFNPDTHRYAVAAAAPLRVRVAPGVLAAVDTVHGEAPLAIRTAYRGSSAPPPHQRLGFWLMLAAAPLPAALVRVRRGGAGTPRVPTPLGQLRTLARGGAGAHDPCLVRRAFAGALAERLGVPLATVTRAGTLARALRRAGVSAEVAADAERLLDQLDEAAYAPHVELSADAAIRAHDVASRIDVEALSRERLRLPPALLVLAVFLPMASTALFAALPQSSARDFERGVASYQLRHFADAAQTFADVARVEPWAADAWANFGTASWAAADTAGAVIGWQRALRLEPNADDARDRLALVQPALYGGLAWVPSMPSSLVFWVGAGAWWIAWLLAASAMLRGRRPGAVVQRRAAYAAGTVAVAFLLGALDVDQRLAARALVVVRATTRLSTEAALGGETAATAQGGEVARVVRRQGVWTRVILDGGREGWVASSGLSSLERGVAGY